ncbi:Uncharacterised protein [Corynebacterium renale]|uniref:hypothetical protein n=1 Tax=Corynebacterium renale TaxID=1724 RepID=UPI000DA32126|nr:hypothetical protein [Corynebacterium renale]SQG64173.1 Uncharacterised protein [Corynebacterium renale]STC94501.1 Uncharacterised protein [Corynebacterium renale]
MSIQNVDGSADNTSATRRSPAAIAAVSLVALAVVAFAVSKLTSSPDVEAAGFAPTTEPTSISPLLDATSAPTTPAVKTETPRAHILPGTPQRGGAAADPFLPPHAHVSAAPAAPAPTRHYRPSNVTSPAGGADAGRNNNRPAEPQPAQQPPASRSSRADAPEDTTDYSPWTPTFGSDDERPTTRPTPSPARPQPDAPIEDLPLTPPPPTPQPGTEPGVEPGAVPPPAPTPEPTPIDPQEESESEVRQEAAEPTAPSTTPSATPTAEPDN